MFCPDIFILNPYLLLFNILPSGLIHKQNHKGLSILLLILMPLWVCIRPHVYNYVVICECALGQARIVRLWPRSMNDKVFPIMAMFCMNRTVMEPITLEVSAGTGYLTKCTHQCL